ncbi:YhcN/YlaJ family sporulation lipoprotein [Pasteuria penetrans]|uniref:YhcN/YlaJ family sporulation lipoprotein n=1 Tax=Pasteuria penetrans TaxID=86005 RepID=UPI000FBA7516|nr:YhcN/YlaJ family sporulation lipoprotein [Pasteuria penetrans]
MNSTSQRIFLSLLGLSTFGIGVTGCGRGVEQRSEELARSSINPSVFSLYRISDDNQSRFGPNSTPAGVPSRERDPGQNDIGFFTYEALSHPERDQLEQQPTLFVDNEALAKGLSCLVGKLDSINHSTVVVHNQSILIGVTPKDKRQELGNDLHQQLLTMAKSITPRSYQIEILSEKQLQAKLDLKDLSKISLSSGIARGGWESASRSSSYASYGSEEGDTTALITIDRPLLARGLGYMLGKNFTFCPSHTLLVTDDIVFVGIPNLAKNTGEDTRDDDIQNRDKSNNNGEDADDPTGGTRTRDYTHGEFIQEAVQMIESITPGYYKVKILDEGYLRDKVNSADLRNVGSDGVTNRQGTLGKIIRELGDPTPPGGLDPTESP